MPHLRIATGHSSIPRPAVRNAAGLLVLIAATMLAACNPTTGDIAAEVVSPPVADSILVPQLASVGHDSVLLAWYEPRKSGGYAFRFATWTPRGWNAVQQVVSDDSVFMHPTDLPSVTKLSSGALGAVWQRRVNKATSGDGWQYEFRVQFSTDGGASWSSPVIPHTGSTLGGEHEFHAAWPTADGRLGMAWIDPRDQTVVTPKDTTIPAQYLGAMQLVATTVSPDGSVAPESVIDDVMCECCPNSVAMTPTGPLLAYRDKRVPAGVPRDSLRYEMNVLRDLSFARLVSADSQSPAHWVSGRRATEDNWIYNGCPNNGPSLAASGKQVALGWWTGEGEHPRVQLKWSTDGGETFGGAKVVSDGRADGQVSVGVSGANKVVAWLQAGAIQVRRYDASGSPSAIQQLGAAGGRHRIPSMIPLSDGSVLLGWIGSGGHLQLRRLRM